MAAVAPETSPATTVPPGCAANYDGSPSSAVTGVKHMDSLSTSSMAPPCSSLAATNSGDGPQSPSRKGGSVAPGDHWGGDVDAHPRSKLTDSFPPSTSPGGAKEGLAAESEQLSRGDFVLAATLFIALGINTLMAWYVTLNVGPYVTKHYFSGSDWGNTLLAMFQAACVGVQVVLLWCGSATPKKSFFYAGGGMNIVAFVLMPPALAYLPEKGALAAMHLICFLLGISSGVLQGAGYPYAGSLPTNFAGFISVGQGAAGMLAFAMNTFFSFVCFDMETREGLTKQVWASYMFCAATAVLYLILFSWQISRPRAHDPFNPSADKTVESDMETGKVSKFTPVATDDGDAVETSGKRPWRVYWGLTWQYIVAVTVLFFVSMNNFPKLGPVGWHYNQQVPNHFIILFGVWSLGELLGRISPDLNRVSKRWFGWTMMNPKLLLPLSCSRIIFYVPFVLGYKLMDTTVVNDFWWYALVLFFFAYTHGWFCTLSFIYSIIFVREEEKGITSSLCVIGLSLGILAGLYIALAY
ncbi:nucleoside transporter protein [Cystoisospora suis]|uniref:Nucleoside transporter protein n=1 Tax=Cystoisospora suis TaxID=483139 RepID=A0A2C6KL04_9APIC|nr:nucleoside transporter protein [Cystoisospora suis]